MLRFLTDSRLARNLNHYFEIGSSLPYPYVLDNLFPDTQSKVLAGSFLMGLFQYITKSVLVGFQTRSSRRQKPTSFHILSHSDSHSNILIGNRAKSIFASIQSGNQWAMSYWDASENGKRNKCFQLIILICVLSWICSVRYAK